jgi:hypothetical protein
MYDSLFLNGTKSIGHEWKAYPEVHASEVGRLRWDARVGALQDGDGVVGEEAGDLAERSPPQDVVVYGAEQLQAALRNNGIVINSAEQLQAALWQTGHHHSGCKTTAGSTQACMV